MFKAIDYRTTRAFQICIIFVTTLMIQRYLKFTHAGWIGFSVMMIYAGFDSGTSLHRTVHRFWGVMFGLLLSYFLWVLMRLDVGFVLFVAPVIVFMAFFTLGKYYVSPTIFMVTLTALGLDYYTLDQYEPINFFFDYTRATVLALAICVFFEYFIFKKSNLTHHFYFDLQQTVIRQLGQLFEIVTNTPVRHSHYLKLSAQLNLRLLELQSFLLVVKHDYHVQTQYFDSLDTFYESIEQIYHNIRQLFVSESSRQATLISETRAQLDALENMIQEQHQDRGEVVCSKKYG